MVARAILSNFCEEQLNQNSPQYVSELSRALCPTTFLELAVYKFIKLSGYPHILSEIIRKADSKVLNAN